MADMYLGDGAGPDGDSGRGALGAIFNWTGALMSVALVAGLGVWGYQLAVRDVTGVPVVRALEGPMRITPDDPGGDQADHQGLAVNNVAAAGVAEGPAERLVLAPPPLELAAEDLPPARLEPEAGREGEGADEADGDVLAFADELADGVTPLSAPIDAAEIAEEDAAAAVDDTPLEIIPATVRGVSRSPLPRPRPAGDPMAEAVAESVAGARAAAPAVEIAAAEVPEGARLVQFGAFASPDEARGEWARLDARFTDFLTGKKRVIEKAVSGGKTFYRLRAMGFEDISDARRFCSTFVADGHGCIPVVAR